MERDGWTPGPDYAGLRRKFKMNPSGKPIRGYDGCYVSHPAGPGQQPCSSVLAAFVDGDWFCRSLAINKMIEETQCDVSAGWKFGSPLRSC